MSPSDRIKREIKDLAYDLQGMFSEHEIIARVTKIVDDAVRDAILITAKVFDGGSQ